MKADAILYKPLGIAVSVLGGLAASAAFRKIWTASTGDEQAPEATDPDQPWRSVLIAAAVQGAVFGLVKAAVDRVGCALSVRAGHGLLTGRLAAVVTDLREPPAAMTAARPGTAR